MEKIKWNDSWKVWKESNAFALVSSVPKDAKEVTLPYDAVFHRPQNPDSVNEGKTGFMDGDTFNYFKEFEVPAADQGKEIRLLIEGSAVKTWVFVNDSFAGECDYPYMEFYVNISPYLKYGQTNYIRVAANSLDLSSRFYVGGGIFRDVYLLKGETVYFEPEKLRITTDSLQGDSADIYIEADICNRAPFSVDGYLTLSIAKKQATGDASTDGQKACLNVRYPLHLAAGKVHHFSRRFCAEHIACWDENHPVLYRCEAAFEDKAGALLDSEQTICGFRTIHIDSHNGLLINGHKTILLGACIHHDQGILGAETYDSYEYYRIKKLKEAGFNAVRSSHNPASKALLRACDELGVYILDEAFDMWDRMKNTSDFSMFFAKNYHTVLETMVKVDYNHPSVIMYSIGNEIMDVATDRGYELCGEMTSILHSLDSKRYVTNAINALLAAGSRLYEIAAEKTGRSASELMRGDVNQTISELGRSMDDLMEHPLIGEMLEYLDGTVDVIGYNYLLSRYQKDCDTYPNRIILGTETHAKRIGEHWKLMQENPAIIGDFIWTGYSYLGETGSRDRFPALHNESCDLDIVGDRRPTSYYRAIVLGQRKEPYIAVRTPAQSAKPMQVGPWSLTDAIPSWNFPGADGQEVDVEVYSGGDEVELFLNGTSLGKKSAHGELCCRALYRISYAPGTLEAVSLKDGVETARYALTTFGSAIRLKVVQEQNQPDAELVFLTVQAINEQGCPVYASIDDLTIHLAENSGLELLGFGSYEARHDSGYQNPAISITSGNALAILRKKTHGTTQISFSAPGIPEEQITVDF